MLFLNIFSFFFNFSNSKKSLIFIIKKPQKTAEDFKLHGEYFKKFLDHYEKRANENLKTTKKTSTDNLLQGFNFNDKENHIKNTTNLENEKEKQIRKNNEDEFLR